MTTRIKPVALITGGSNGIGLELAKQFASNGYDLILASSNPARLDNAAQTLQNGPGKPQVATVAVDLATDKGAEQLYKTVQKLNWHVEVLVNNAGAGVYGPFIETDLQAEQDIIHLNVISLTQLTKMFVKDMQPYNNGKILFTASIASVAPSPNLAVYAATKAYVYSFSEALRDELKTAGSKITVTALMPNATDTDFFNRAGAGHTQTANMNSLDSAADVAKAGFEALMRGDDHVVCTSKGKMSAFMTKFISPTLAASMNRIE